MSEEFVDPFNPDPALSHLGPLRGWYDPELKKWEGDPDELLGHYDELAGNDEICQEIFMSEREALVMGYFVGRAEAMDEIRGHAL